MPEFIFLGSGDSRGTPRILCSCEVCKTSMKRNVRTRSSVVVSAETGESLLIDISPDVRQQFLSLSASALSKISAAIVTHAHNDHIGGLGDYYDFLFWGQKQVKIYSSRQVISEIITRFPYLNKKKNMCLTGQTHFFWAGYEISLYILNHGRNGQSQGVFFKSCTSGYEFAYAPDCFDLSPDQMNFFCGLDLLIMGTPYFKEETPRATRSLYDVNEALSLRERLGIPQLILTHLSHEIDYKKHSQLLPAGVFFAFDNMLIKV